jgi:hypothetical protein
MIIRYRKLKVKSRMTTRMPMLVPCAGHWAQSPVESLP